MQWIYFENKAQTEAKAAELETAYEKGGREELRKLHPEYHEGRIFANIAAARTEGDRKPYFQAMAADTDIRQRIAKDYDKSFEKALHQEHQRRSWQLNSASAALHNRFVDFDMGRQFVEFGIGSGRVFLSNPIIAPMNTEAGIDYSEVQNALPWISIKETLRLNGYKHNLGFIELNTMDANQKRKNMLLPTIFIDHHVMDSLQQVLERGTPEEKKSTEQMLSAMRIIFMMGMHDFVHHTFYNHPSNYRNSPEFATRTSGLGSDVHAPLAEQQEIKELSSLSKVFSLHPGIVAKKEAVIEHDPQKTERLLINGMSSLELQAELFNRNIWLDIFSKNRNVKNNFLRLGRQFVTNLETYRQAATRLGQQDADNIASFLLRITMNRFFRNVAIDDPALHDTIKEGGNKESGSFADACEHLGLPSITITPQQVKTFYDRIKLTWATPEKHPPHPQVFAKLEGDSHFPALCTLPQMCEQMENTSQHSLRVKGFEAVVASALMEESKRFSRTAILYDFAPGFSNNKEFPSSGIALLHAWHFDRIGKEDVPAYVQALENYNHYLAEYVQKQMDERKGMSK